MSLHRRYHKFVEGILFFDVLFARNTIQRHSRELTVQIRLYCYSAKEERGRGEGGGGEDFGGSSGLWEGFLERRERTRLARLSRTYIGVRKPRAAVTNRGPSYLRSSRKWGTTASALLLRRVGCLLGRSWLLTAEQK